MNRRVRQVIDGLLEQFKNGNIPEAIAYAKFPHFDIPCNKWSLLNKLIVCLSATGDARGFRQWQQVNRFVKKGAKAIYIIVPYIKKEENEESKTDNEVLKGFMAKPVFRYEDTEGEEIDYKQIDLPELPLMEKARQWGIQIEAIPGNDEYYGYYAPQREIIALASPEEKVFFHELAHASHKRVDNNYSSLKTEVKEIIADFSAQVLCQIVGKTYEKNIGETYKYVSVYAKRMKMTTHSACLKLISDIERVLSNILEMEAEYV